MAPAFPEVNMRRLSLLVSLLAATAWSQALAPAPVVPGVPKFCDVVNAQGLLTDPALCMNGDLTTTDGTTSQFTSTGTTTTDKTSWCPPALSPCVDVLAQRTPTINGAAGWWSPTVTPPASGGALSICWFGRLDYTLTANTQTLAAISKTSSGAAASAWLQVGTTSKAKFIVSDSICSNNSTGTDDGVMVPGVNYLVCGTKAAGASYARVWLNGTTTNPGFDATFTGVCSVALERYAVNMYNVNGVATGTTQGSVSGAFFTWKDIGSAGALSLYNALQAYKPIDRATTPATALANGSSGSGASDVVVKVGTSLADGSTNASAKLLSVRTGLGATEVEKFYVRGDGATVAGAITAQGDLSTQGVLGMTQSYALVKDANAWVRFEMDTNGVGGLNYYQGGASDGASAIAHMFTNMNALSNATAKIASFEAGANNANEKAYITALGTFGHPGSIPDASGSPGNATQNGPKGKAAMANAAAAVTITNNQVNVNSIVNIQWEADPGQRHWVTYAAGSFTLNTTSAVAANKTFRWYVVQ